MKSSKKQSLEQNNHIQVLNGIRGLAFLMVLISHLSNYYGSILQGIGKVGVWLFFVLSAYLLTFYFLSNKDKISSKYEWANYLLRRFFRIIPLYILVLYIYLYNEYLINRTNILNHLLLKEGAGHLWTIPTEFKFYLILPFVVIIIYFLRFNVIWAALVLTIITVVHQVAFPAHDSEISSISTLTYLPVFLMGSLAALIQVKIKEINLSRKAKYSFDLFSIVLFGVLIITIPGVWSQIFYPVESTYFYKDFIYFGVLLSLLLISIQNGTGLISYFLESDLLIFFGKISYSGYLIHPLVLFKVKHSFPSLNSFDLSIISFVLILLFSLLLHWIIEKPCMRISIPKKG